MPEFLIIIIVVVVVFALVFGIKAIVDNKSNPHRGGNKSGSPDYVYKNKANKYTLGGTNLDRFYIECVLSKCNDFSVQENKEKAEKLAQKYNLNYDKGIEYLFSKGMLEHKEISDNIKFQRNKW